MSRPIRSLCDEIRASLPGELPPRLGVAVSGGGDSVALLDVLQTFAGAETELFAATVDHGLRPGSADEAATVAALAQRMGVTHETLHWQGWDGSGNLQDQARQARYRLLTEWVRRNDLGAVALGHTADDQAETVLMRLARASGVNGLSAMPVQRVQDGVLLVRPMLGITRARLREHLRDRGISWVEDPSNQDLRFDRIRVRKALTELAPLGIDAETLARVARNMTQTRDTLERIARDAAQDLTRLDASDVLVDRAGFLALPDDIARRILVGIVGWIAGRFYSPRQSAIAQADDAIQRETTGVLAGCLILPEGSDLRFCREYNAVRDLAARPGQPWDRRWILRGPETADAVVRALGEDGLRQLPDWRVTGRQQAALRATPAVWRGDELLAAPLAGWTNEWRVEPVAEKEEFLAAFLSH